MAIYLCREVGAKALRELGAVYLGGISLVELAAAGLVTELTDGALVQASLAFGSHRAPVAAIACFSDSTSFH